VISRRPLLLSDAAPTNRLIIAGGGLAGSLAALAIAGRRPDVDLLLVEGADRLGGNHIWSFFDSDVAAADKWLVEPLISARWRSYEVRFPAHRRVIDEAYQSIRSERLDEVVRARLGERRLRLGARIAAVEPDAVVLESGERLSGAVLDARGGGQLEALELGWQKFLGVDFRFDTPHGVDRPVIMDATVDQSEGYRFVYLLPFSATELLVEDTYYSDAPDLDAAALRSRIDEYLAARGLGRGRAVREETGVLPVTIGGDLDAFLAGSGPAKLGMRGGFFHPTTGYSLPDAVRVAALLARQPALSAAALHALLDAEARRLWRRRGFYRMLNRMLFHAAKPSERYKVLQRFYRLSPGLIGRFYSGRSTRADKLRTLVGKPPIPIPVAVSVLVRRRRVA
jgi:lycopene beta-cyclase